MTRINLCPVSCSCPPHNRNCPYADWRGAYLADVSRLNQRQSRRRPDTDDRASITGMGSMQEQRLAERLENTIFMPGDAT